VHTVIDWLKILSRQGWLGSARRNNRDEHEDQGGSGLAALMRKRAAAMLHLRYGKAAEAADLQGSAAWPHGPRRPLGESLPDPEPPPA
jgi:hypothetical protein